MLLRPTFHATSSPLTQPQRQDLFTAQATFQGAQETLANLADNEPTSAWVWKSAAQTVIDGAALVATALVPNTEAFVQQTTNLATQLLVNIAEGDVQPPAVLALAEAVSRQAAIGVRLVTQLTSS